MGKSIKLCFDLKHPLEYKGINYTYKDGYFHTRLSTIRDKTIVAGFEDKLSFVTSLAFAHFLRTNPVMAEDLESWDNILKKFVKSDEYKTIMFYLSQPRFWHSKGLKILKPYSKKKSITIPEFIDDWDVGVPKSLIGFDDFFTTLFSKASGMTLGDFLRDDGIFLVITEEVKVDNSKFENKHKIENSLWD